MLLEVIQNEQTYTCYQIHNREDRVYRWSDKREAKAFERLHKQAGWAQNRQYILELEAPDGTVVGRAVKGIFEDYRTYG